MKRLCAFVPVHYVTLLMNLLCSWSGGKDSCFALMQMNQRPTVIFTTLNEWGDRSRSHGLSPAILDAQAKAIGCPSVTISTSWDNYTEKYIARLKSLTNEYQLTDAVFGDIDLQPHREWEEKVCAEAQLNCHLPLWKKNRKELVFTMIESGIKTMIVSCNDTLGASFLGRIMDAKTVEDLEARGVDVCGENGEFHTVVLDCPLFQYPIEVIQREKLIHNNYHFLELSLI